MPLIYVVPQSHCVVIERFGRFSRVQQAGIRMRVPIMESIRWLGSWQRNANKDGWLLELSEQQTDTPARQCHTKDNVAITANASVYWRIIDPRKAVYEVDVLPQAVSDVALNALRSNVGAMELDQVLSERQLLNDRIAAQLTQTATKWGVLFTRVEIQELTTSGDVSSSMLQQMDADRRRRAMVSEAEGKAAAEVRLAEAEKNSIVLRAQGKAEALQLIADAELSYLRCVSQVLGPDAAKDVLIAQKFIDGFDVISKNPANKVFLPNAFAGLLPAIEHGHPHGTQLSNNSHSSDRA